MSQSHKLPTKNSTEYDSTTLVLAHLIVWATIVAHIVLANQRTVLERQGGAAAGVVILMLLILRAVDAARGNRYLKLFMGLYLVCASLALLFLSDPGSTYSIMWLIIVIFGYLHFGKKGVWLTIICFSAAELTKYLYFASSHGITFRESVFMLINFFIVVGISNLYIRMQAVYDSEHRHLKTSVRESQIEQKRLKALINNMTETVLVLDTKGQVKLYNAAALGLFDTNSNLEGKKPGDFVTLENEKGNSLDLLDLLPKDDPKPVARDDILLRYSAEDTAALSLTITPLRASFGQKEEDTGYVVTMRDITREKSLEEERNEFISVISHELRTPVTVTEASISNAMFINDRGVHDEKVGNSLRVAHDQSIYLANMLNDLSTFARAEKGMLELNLEDLDPRELLAQLEKDYGKEVEVKDMHIAIDILEGTPEKLMSNRLYVREILQNFITNAIKYSDSGTITLIAGPAEGGVKFGVRDEGIGISTSDQKKVFEKFFRSEDFRTRSRNGTGLGLYVVKKLAKILRASFELESEVGKGSTFGLIVPDLSHLKEKHHPDTASAQTETEDLHTPGAPAPVIDGTSADQPTGQA
jgi:two-component system phosphate regulon sensor histidine kinase PhoR